MPRTSLAPDPTARVSATRSAFDSLVLREEFALVTVDRYVLFVWRTQIDKAGATAFIDAIRRTHLETSLPVGTAVHFAPQVDVTHPPDVRREFVQGFAELRGCIGASALIRAGGGFPAAVLRSSVTAMQLEHGNSHGDTAYFPDVEPALDWVVRSVQAANSQVPVLVRMLNLLAEGRFDALGDGWQREHTQR